MEYQEACTIFNLVETDPLDPEFVRKQYLKLCLKYHPDKNLDDPECVAQFQRVQEAYLILTEEDQEVDPDPPDPDQDLSTFNVMSKLPKWLQAMIPSILEFRQNPLWGSLIRILEQRVIKWADSLDKDVLLNIHDFMEKVTKKGGIDGQIPMYVKEVLSKVIQTKTVNDKFIVLNPALEDLFACRVIRHIEIDTSGCEFVYMIPSWVEESVFDLPASPAEDEGQTAGEIIFTCIPKCPEGSYIDEYRNVHFSLEFPIEDLFRTQEPGLDENRPRFATNPNIRVAYKTLKFEPWNGVVFNISIPDLFLRCEQTVVFRGRGIPKVANSQDVFDIRKYSDVVLHLRLYTKSSWDS
jgi:DnaJ domain